MTQARESDDGLRCEFLRQFYAALVSCTIGFIEIDFHLDEFTVGVFRNLSSFYHGNTISSGALV